VRAISGCRKRGYGTREAGLYFVGTRHSVQRLPEMPNYSFFLIELDGYLVASTCVSCRNDIEALTKGAELLRTFQATIEVWDGARKVGQREPAALHGNGDRMVGQRPDRPPLKLVLRSGVES
jgi:hypothetical protein